MHKLLASRSKWVKSPPSIREDEDTDEEDQSDEAKDRCRAGLRSARAGRPTRSDDGIADVTSLKPRAEEMEDTAMDIAEVPSR